ncbi:MAG TPA: Calx-beta domain-containing protein, partial [Verrucomicrobiae bacterium]|nr:Calx-beta domain-containing protein [Verrucomicrobiae bacterium]
PTGQSPAQLPKALFSLAGILTAVHTQPDGKVIIGGTFSAVNGQPRQNLARLNANGSLDLTWNVAVDGPVDVILMRGDSVFLGGAFSKVNGVGRAGLAKVQSSDGQLDEIWNPNPESTGHIFAEWQKRFYALLAVGDFIYVSGDFRAIGEARRTGLAKIAIQGTGLADPDWNPRLTVEHMSEPVVMALAVVEDKLVIGGGFDRINGLPRRGLVKLSLTRSDDLDTIWNPVLPGSGAIVQQVLVHGSNLIVGYFTGFDANITTVGLEGIGITGQPVMPPRDTSITFQAMTLTEGGLVVIRNNDDAGATVFRLNFPDLTLAASPWQAPVFQQGLRAVFSFYNAAQLNALTTRANRVLIGGFFNVVNGAPALGLAAIDPVTGELDPSFNVFVQRPGRVLAMARQPDGKLVVGGEFDTVDDLPRANLIRFNADGVLDPTWFPNPNGTVRTVLATESNLFVGGVFTSVKGSDKGHLVRFDYANDRPDPAWPSALEPMPLPATHLATSGEWLFELEFDDNESSSSLVVRDRATGAIARKFEGDALALTPGPDGQLIVAGFGLHPGRGYELVRVDPQPPFAFDPNWNPSVQGDFFGARLAVSGSNVFIATSDRVFKFPLSGSDLPSPGWQVPDVFSKPDRSSGLVQGIEALAVVGTDLFVGGTFWPIGAPVPPVGGNGKTMLARLDSETGAINALWNTGSDIPFGVRSLFADGHNLYVGGRFGRFGDDTRFALALLATPGAPALFESAPDLVTILRNPDDGPEVTHFRIVALNGGVLQRISDSTLVLSGDFVTVADGQAGLRFLPGAGSPSVTAVSAVSPTPPGAGSAAATLDLQSALVPVFSFSQEEYRFSEANDSVTLTVLKQGLGPGSVRVSTSDGTASVSHFPEPGDYQGGSGRIMLAGTKYDFQISLVRDEIFEGDEVFYVTLSEPSPGARLGYPARARVVIVDDDRFGPNGSFLARQQPTAPPHSTGILAVYLKSDVGAWRLTGEWDWHASGEMVSGLIATNYQVEFKPLSGYAHPDTQTIPIAIGQINYVTNEYGGRQPSEEVGALTVIIDPPEIAGNPDPTSAPRWRLAGESDGAWRRSGEVAANLSSGFHEVTLKPLSNYFVHILEPVVWVSAERTRTNYARYLPATGSGSVEPQVLTFTQATEVEPFCYNGQIKSRVGVGSGVVVKEGVVLTAAHLVFDDKNLEWVDALDIQWLFQRYRGQHEPVAQRPYGTVILAGYAAQRTNDMRDLGLVPGVSTPNSQNLDVALLFFLEPAGRGGFGGFMVSEDPNEHLLSSRRKMLVGYPKDGVPEINQGKPHATVAANLPFQLLYPDKSVYVAGQVRGLPGNSGGPMYVEAEGGGRYYPAGVYVGQTTSGQSLVRAIDGLVVDYINRVEELRRSGPNHPGGGFDPFIPGVTKQPTGTGLLTFELVPEAARAAGAGWRIRQNSDKTWVTNATLTYPLTGGVDYDVEFRAAPAFIAPMGRQVRVDIGEVASLKLRYVRWPGELEFRDHWQVSLLGSNRGRYVIEYRTSLSLTDQWLPWATMTLTNSPMVLDLSVDTNVAQRFFRMGLTNGL